jgi:uncharacterized protein with GYD domain
MADFITLIKFTEKGVATIKDGPARLDAAREVFKKYGVEMKGFFLTLGRYDAVLISQAPDAAAVVKATLTIGQRGNVRTETLRAYPEAEYRKLVAELG